MTSEPALPVSSPLAYSGGVGSEDSRRRFPWLGRLSAPADGMSPPAVRREPFDRLKFYTVPHGLTKRLSPYEANGSPSTFRYSHWATLRYWMLLLDEDDEALVTFAGFETEIPDPDVWFGRVKV